jgi:hypothetical protein
VTTALGDRVADYPQTARVFVISRRTVPLAGALVEVGGSTDSKPSGATYVYRVAAGSFPLSPGETAVAELPGEGEAQHGVLLPRDGVVRMQGRAWVYVQSGDRKFNRRPMPTAHPVDGGWFASEGFSAGERVVVDGAEALLTEELKLSYKPAEAE